MLRACSIASGSRGNCLFVSSEQANILVDVGVDLKRLEMSLVVLGSVGAKLDGILITHSHNDHVSGLESLCKKYSVPVYCHAEIADKIGNIICKTQSKVHPFEDIFFLKDITVSPFLVKHDVHCVGYTLVSMTKQLSIATDMGQYTKDVIDAMSGSDIVFVESNYDEDMLKNGKYPEFLKKRVASHLGHLSNYECGNLVSTLINNGTRQFVLSHLSQNNNYPELAYSSVVDRLKCLGIDNKDAKIEIAMQDRLSNLYQL
ncbi:MAG: MBL fold metallo-hydrolase [Firmicutes bacterium]|nr:MBL fold metallo-hydrolase [Bacillota bacterium]MCL1953515.1 MBL fold metallo-hydrolase [Bacillota bacterium]